MGKAALQKAGGHISKKFRNLVKKIIVICIIAGFLISSLITCAYFSTDEDVGETGSVIDYGNVVASGEDGEPEITSYSPANAGCLDFYYVLSRNKSAWQEVQTDDGIELIRPTDEEAVSDCFRFDEDYVLHPYFLYSVADALFSDGYVFPEAFLKPVAYDASTHTLSDIKGEDGKVLVSSEKRSLSDGSGLGVEMNGVSDYGLASVLTYETQTRTTSLEYSYIGETAFGEQGVYVQEYAVPEHHSEILSSEDEHILTHAVTFAGDVSYSYEDTHDRTHPASGEGSADENVLSVYMGDRTVTCYYAIPYYGPQTRDRYRYSTSPEYLWETYCQNGAYYLPRYSSADASDASDAEGSETGAETGPEGPEAEEDSGTEEETNPFSDCRTTTYTYPYYRYRSTDSGIYESFVRNTGRTANDIGTEYLYEYLSIFSTYTPNVERSYDVFHSFTSSSTPGTMFLALTGTEGETSGYNGTTGNYSEEQLVTARMLWDGLLQWGYTEEQAGAVLGNICQESRFTPGVIQSNGVGHGLAQWSVDGRFVNLSNYASAIGTDWTDALTQITFILMEMEGVDSYSYVPSHIWGPEKETYQTFMSEDATMDERVEAFCNGWEIAGDPHMSARVSFAYEFYNLFSGSEIEYEIPYIEPDSGGNADETFTPEYLPSGGLSEADRALFREFYFAPEAEGVSYQYYERFLGESEIDHIINMTDSMIEKTTITEQSRDSNEDGPWQRGYLSAVASSTDESYSVYTADCDFLFPYVAVNTPHMSSVFGFRESFMTDSGHASSSAHQGFDLPVPSGTEVLAVQEGTVVFAGWSGGYGNYVKLEHELPDGTVIQTGYAHNSSLNVHTGDHVSQGQVIAYSGSTGNSTGPHLHFECYKDGYAYNAFLTLWGRVTDIPAIDADGNQISVDVTPLTGWDYSIYKIDANNYYTKEGVVSKR